ADDVGLDESGGEVRGDEGAGDEGASELLEDDHGFGHAEVRSRFEAQVEYARIAQFLPAFTGERRPDGELLRAELADRVAQEDLVRTEVEVQRRASTRTDETNFGSFCTARKSTSIGSTPAAAAARRPTSTGWMDPPSPDTACTREHKHETASGTPPHGAFEAVSRAAR